MDQEETLDFKALRAKFQDEELLLKQPKIKPALPEKPKVFPPPHSPTHHLPAGSPTHHLPAGSPTHHLPAGARPSLLTSISQSLEGKTTTAPRVVFKYDKKDSKTSLIQPNTKEKEKTEGKLKGGKDKTTKGSKEKLDTDGKTDLLDQKQKKQSSKDKKLTFMSPKEGTTELVPATPPPKATTKKKGFLGFKKSMKKEIAEVPPEPILDAPSPDVPGPAPLIPAPLIPVPLISAPLIPAPLIPAPLIPAPLIPAPLGESTPEAAAETQAPRALMPQIPTLPDSNTEATTPPSSTPALPNITSPPSFIPDIPTPKVLSPESETPPEIETSAPPVSVPPRSVTPTTIIPTPPSPVPSPSPICMEMDISHSPPAASSPSLPPEPEVAAVVGVEEVDMPAMENPPAPVIDPPSVPSSPKAERPISALSALERAEEMSPGKKTPCDQRIFSALEKARRKTTSPLSNHTTSYSTIPTPEEETSPNSPTHSLPQLPPIDYEDRARKALSAQVNGFDHTQASPMLEGIAEERADIPELLEVPPPPPRKTLPESLGPAPEKPARPPTVDLSAYLPPSLEDYAVEIPAPPEFSEADSSVEIPEFEDVSSYTHSPELPVSEWENGVYDSPGRHTLPETMNQFYSNGITVPGAEVHGVSESGVELQENPQPEPALDVLHSSSPVSEETLPITGPQAENGAYESGENFYEDIATSATKKKGKSEGGKKRKGPPKNPYAETSQPPNEEKSKTSRFGKIDKKTSPEGPDEKELKKKEKQRLEKEKKELKEQKEREKKEQKEREKRENELKKKFKITGQEDAIYQAKVTVTTKGSKNDLPVKCDDIISIIRTTNCPRGKWLARDSSNTYGYIAVDHVELDIKEMLELGKKAAITRQTSSNIIEAEATSMGSRTSNHYPLSTGSFTDDSEEWTGDDDEPLSSPTETVDPLSPPGHTRTHSMPEMGNKELDIIHQHSHSDISTEGSHMQARHEALEKLATFFHSPKPVVEPSASSTEPETSPVVVEEEVFSPPESTSTQEMDVELPGMIILPPPDLYADIITVE